MLKKKSLAHKKILWKLTLKEITELFAKLYLSHYPMIYVQEALHYVKNYIEVMKETEYKDYLYDILLGDLGRKLYEFLKRKRENTHTKSVETLRFEPILYISDENRKLIYRNLVYLLSITDNVMRRYYYYFLKDIDKADYLTYYISLKYIEKELLRDNERVEEEKLFKEYLHIFRSQIKNIDDFYKGISIILNSDIFDIHEYEK